MNRTTLALSLTLVAGCATRAVSPEPSPAADVPPSAIPELDYDDWNENNQAMTDSLERLNALEIIDVTEMVVDAPTGAMNCYGPCADDPVDQAWMQEHARQTARLQALTEAAEDAANAGVGPVDAVDEAIESLQALRIVEIGGLTNASNCYGPCPEDAGAVKALAEAAQNL